MKHAIAAVLVVGLASPASAGSFTFVVQTDGQPAIEYKLNVADADVQKFIVAYSASYFPNGVEAAGGRAPSSQELVNAIGAGLWAGMTANVVNYFRAKAAAEAANTVSPIEGTPVSK